MNDLIERLKKSGDACEFTARSKLLQEAADEIERLRNQLVQARKALEPLATLADAVFAKYETSPGTFREAYSDRPDTQEVWAFNRTSLTYGHLRAARTAFTDEIGKP